MKSFKGLFRDREGSQTSQDRASRADQPRADVIRTVSDKPEQTAVRRSSRPMTLGDVFAGRRSSE
jgi:hypothetical protein